MVYFDVQTVFAGNVEGAFCRDPKCTVLTPEFWDISSGLLLRAGTTAREYSKSEQSLV